MEHEKTTLLDRPCKINNSIPDKDRGLYGINSMLPLINNVYNVKHIFTQLEIRNYQCNIFFILKKKLFSYILTFVVFISRCSGGERNLSPTIMRTYLQFYLYFSLYQNIER